MKREKETREISIETTYGCGMDCVMCSSSAVPICKVSGDELSIETFEGLMDEARKLGMRTISLSGGEPFLRPALIDYALRNFSKVLIYTSGVIPKGIQEDSEVEPIPDHLLAYAKQPNAVMIFDFQCSHKKIFNQIIGKYAFDAFMDTFKRTTKITDRIETHLVPMKPNYKYIEDTVRYIVDRGAQKVSFLRLVPQGRALDNFYDLAISVKEFKELQQLFIDLYRADLPIRLGHPIDWRALLEPNRFKKPSCRGGSDAPLVNPFGRVDVCPAWKRLDSVAAGWYPDRSFSRIWSYGHTYQAFRQFIHEEGWISIQDARCRVCDFLPDCKGGCVAQRLISWLHHPEGPREISDIYKAISEAPRDPMCFIELL